MRIQLKAPRLWKHAPGPLLLGFLSLVFLSALLWTLTGRPSSARILDDIEQNAEAIRGICSEFRMDPRQYVSVIYGELSSNLDYYDRFDEVRARVGFNPSIGFAQLKVSTAMWLEERLSEAGTVEASATRQELVDRLLQMKANITYSVFYLSLIRERLVKEGTKEPSLRSLGSYYARGIETTSENLSVTYFNPVGTKAEEFYHSDLLVATFPRY